MTEAAGQHRWRRKSCACRNRAIVRCSSTDWIWAGCGGSAFDSRPSSRPVCPSFGGSWLWNVVPGLVRQTGWCSNITIGNVPCQFTMTASTLKASRARRGAGRTVLVNLAQEEGRLSSVPSANSIFQKSFAIPRTKLGGWHWIKRSCETEWKSKPRSRTPTGFLRYSERIWTLDAYCWEFVIAGSLRQREVLHSPPVCMAPCRAVIPDGCSHLCRSKGWFS